MKSRDKRQTKQWKLYETELANWPRSMDWGRSERMPSVQWKYTLVGPLYVSQTSDVHLSFRMGRELTSGSSQLGARHNATVSYPLHSLNASHSDPDTRCRPGIHRSVPSQF